MYFNDGINPNEIGDFEVVEHEGKLHVFHLTLPSHDRIGHLISDNGIEWTELPPALFTGNPGEFDGDQIWTPGIFKNGSKWFMLYTGNERNGKIQRIGLATSEDLMKWDKYPGNPVISPDKRWYEAEQTGRFRIDWRDPHVVYHDGLFHAFISARENSGTLNRRGCTAYFVSADGYSWDACPPACAPRTGFDFECPSVCEIRNRFYMFAILGGHDRMVYRIAEKVEGPYRRPFDDSLTPGKNKSVRPVFWKGQTHLMHWCRGPRDWDGLFPHYAAMGSPKLAHVEADGSLRVESFDWSPLYSGNSISLCNTKNASSYYGKWTSASDSSFVAEVEEGYAGHLSKEEFKDFEINAEIKLDETGAPAEFGIAIRTDEEGDTGIFLHCVPSRNIVELVRVILNRPYGPESLTRSRTVLQSFHMHVCEDGCYKMRAVAFGPSVEFNLNGRLVLQFFTMPDRSGKAGVFIESGKAIFKDISIQPIREPVCNYLQ